MSNERFLTHENTEMKYKYNSLRNPKHYKKTDLSTQKS